MPITTIIPPTPIVLPAPLPQPNHPTFAVDALNWVNYWHGNLAPAINTMADGIYNNAQFVSEKATLIGTQADNVQAWAQASATTGVGKLWVANAAYVTGSATTVPDTVYVAGSPNVTYRCIVSHSGISTPPNLDPTNWAPMGILATVVREAYVAVAAANIDVSQGGVYSKTITGATTFTLSNVPAASTVASFILEITNGGSAAVTWWAGIKWNAGVVPALTTAGTDLLGFYTRDGGTTWRGTIMALDSK